MANASALAKKIAAKARQQRIIDTEKAIKEKKARKAREALAFANSVTPDGYTPAMRAKLQDASKRASQDPRAKAIVEKAVLTSRVERLRREQGIGQVAPPMFMGEPADSRGAPIIPPKNIPPSVGDAVTAERKKRT